MLLRTLVLLSVTACGGSESPTTTVPDQPTPRTINVSPGERTLTFIGQTAAFTSLILDQNGSTFGGNPTWASGDESVFTVNASGVVTAVGNGTGTVTASFQSLSTTATVTVAQVAAAVTIVSGDAQTAITGETLTTPVVVRVTDQGGAPIPGETVTFTPGAESGTVSVASAASDANGEASTVWTLGGSFGGQTLTASISGGASASIGAIAQSATPISDLKTGGSVIVTRSDPSSLETVEVQFTVRNDGNGATESGYRVQLTADGVEIATKDLGVLGVGATETVTFTVGPFAEGVRTLAVNIDADDAIEEGDEDNNTTLKNITVLEQTAIVAGTFSGLSGTTGDELLFKLDVPVGSPSILTFELSGGTGDVDLFVEAGERPTNRDGYDDCLSGSPTTVERCQIGSAQPGTYHILLHAFSTFSGVTMEITLGGEVLPFNIELVFIDNGTATQDAAVTAAAERWMSIIPLDIPNSDFSTDPLAADACVTGQPLFNGEVDDLRIYVSIVEIDGLSGTLAQAGPCITRGLTNLPIVGSMKFDAADLTSLEESGGLLPVILHEMGHVLGLGTIWSQRGLLQNPSLPSSPGADTHFNGPLAIEAFDAAGGSSYTLGQKVPVENTAGEGSSDSHWRETLLGLELMTPFFTPGQSNPLSAISIQSMADVGYSVDVSEADPYSGSFSSPSRAPSKLTPVLDLSNDIRQGAIYVVDQKGRVIRVVN
jgi:CARDB protein/leishmanolysin